MAASTGSRAAPGGSSSAGVRRDGDLQAEPSQLHLPGPRGTGPSPRRRLRARDRGLVSRVPWPAGLSHAPPRRPRRGPGRSPRAGPGRLRGRRRPARRRPTLMTRKPSARSAAHRDGAAARVLDRVAHRLGDQEVPGPISPPSPNRPGGRSTPDGEWRTARPWTAIASASPTWLSTAGWMPWARSRSSSRTWPELAAGPGRSPPVAPRVAHVGLRGGQHDLAAPAAAAGCRRAGRAPAAGGSPAARLDDPQPRVPHLLQLRPRGRLPDARSPGRTSWPRGPPGPRSSCGDRDGSATTTASCSPELAMIGSTSRPWRPLPGPGPSSPGAGRGPGLRGPAEHLQVGILEARPAARSATDARPGRAAQVQQQVDDPGAGEPALHDRDHERGRHPDLLRRTLRCRSAPAWPGRRTRTVAANSNMVAGADPRKRPRRRAGRAGEMPRDSFHRREPHQHVR